MPKEEFELKDTSKIHLKTLGELQAEQAALDEIKKTLKRIQKNYDQRLANWQNAGAKLFGLSGSGDTGKKRQTWTPEQKAKIIKKYDAAKEGTKTAVLKEHGVKANPIGTWKDQKDVKMAMQKIQEKK
ncbi:hypothetical protein C1J05_04055 [Sulfitobacter sp. JL08]|uniref:transposase n=1 Tax=Sulfitobacter sp. JL08 TaxID=2070369 RepID=UPI000E0A59C3|nr:transposase [Sulfitobacter sp. JL08]AXI53782.1 hypothetical protein C1J05_04055 [Sulfitobacter sp. JL08]